MRPPSLDRTTAQSWIALVALSVLVALVAACSGPGEDGASSSESALAQQGRWTLPANIVTVGKTVRLTYDDAPKWTGTAACAGKLKTGGKKLGDYLVDKFDVVTSVGGYACRRNTADTSRMSVHGTGRALDVFVPRTGGAADNGQGDKVANWLVLNAQRIGVQLVIWDRTIWRSNGSNDGAYGGPHPHDDHLHVELTNAGGAASTPWFANPTDGDASTDGGNTDAGNTTTDGGGVRDASADARGDSGSTGSTDSGTTPVVDAGTKDAAPIDPPEDEDDKPDAGGPKPGEPPGSANGDPSSGLGSAGDDPGETDSLDPSSKRRAPSVEDDEPIPTGGCSAAPGSTPRAGSLGSMSAMSSLLALALGLAAWRRRRQG